MDDKDHSVKILVVDDDQSILDSFAKVFARDDFGRSTRAALAKLDEKLFNSSSSASERCNYNVTYCLQGNEATDVIHDAIKENHRYRVAFIDMRMPPGPDGLETARQIRNLDPDISIVIVTGYSDVDPSEISTKAGPADKIYYVKKPFHPAEIQQFSRALSAKWLAEQKLLAAKAEVEKRVKERTRDLEIAYEALKVENIKRREMATSLKETEAILRTKADDLEKTNTALTVLVRKIEEDRKNLEDNIFYNMREMISPYITKFKRSNLSKKQVSLLATIEMNLKEILNPFMRDLSFRYIRLTNQEIQIANLIKRGKSSKEIADHLGFSIRTVEFWRDKIRQKLGIKNTKVNLRKLLHDMASKYENENTFQ
jgi:FixJ family two-component response regulator